VGWLAAQPWCNGNVGTFGCSYPCEVQYLQAPLRHPQLKCMIPQNGPALGAANGRYRYWSGYKGGVMDWAASYPWYADAGSKYTYQPPPGLSDDEIREMRRFYDPTPSQWEEPDFEQVSTAAGTTFSLAGLRFHTDGAVFQADWTLPLTDVMQAIGAPPNDFDKLLTTPFGDPWWHDTMGYYDGSETIDVPALHVSTWCKCGRSLCVFLRSLKDAAAQTTLRCSSPSTPTTISATTPPQS